MYRIVAMAAIDSREDAWMREMGQINAATRGIGECELEGPPALAAKELPPSSATPPKHRHAID